MTTSFTHIHVSYTQTHFIAWTLVHNYPFQFPSGHGQPDEQWSPGQSSGERHNFLEKWWFRWRSSGIWCWRKLAKSSPIHKTIFYYRWIIGQSTNFSQEKPTYAKTIITIIFPSGSSFNTTITTLQSDFKDCYFHSHNRSSQQTINTSCTNHLGNK